MENSFWDHFYLLSIHNAAVWSPRIPKEELLKYEYYEKLDIHRISLEIILIAKQIRSSKLVLIPSSLHSFNSPPSSPRNNGAFYWLNQLGYQSELLSLEIGVKIKIVTPKLFIWFTITTYQIFPSFIAFQNWSFPKT